MTMLFIALTLPVLAGGPSPRPNGLSPALGESVATHRRDLASEVRTILSVKCAECHGAKLPQPKGHFGHVEDLKRVAGNPELVVPFQPAQSKLWKLVRNNEMPPEHAKAGALTAGQKYVIRAWIESGAGTGADAQTSVAITSAADTSADAATEGEDVPSIEHLLSWLGKFHVLVVHFPIALLVVAAVGELWSLCHGSRDPAPAVRLCVLFAAAGGAAATALGWLHATFSGYAANSSNILALHRWTGTAAGVVALGVAILSEVDARRGVRSPFFRILLFAGTLLVSVAGHSGGLLVYGDSYFNW